MKSVEFFTVGYGRWPVARRLSGLLGVLEAHRIEMLVDIRHSPCPSNLDPANPYGPREWHLRADGSGLVGHLRSIGVDYLWAVELGNPQKTDGAMTVLREHLADAAGDWPVHRGLALVSRLIREDGKRCCLLCACDEFDACHRKPVAEALARLLPPDAVHRDLNC